MKRLYALLALFAVGVSTAFGAFSTTPDPTGPGSVRAVVDLPGSLHMRNSVGIDGQGLCVFTSVEVSGRYQGVNMDGFQTFMTKRLGGGTPPKLDQMIRSFFATKGTPAPDYVQTTAGDVGFLELVLKTGRPVWMTYGGLDDFYRDRFGRPTAIAHMVVGAYLDNEVGAILDNNRPGVWVWMTRAELLSRWKMNGGGWAGTFLAPPPPPPAKRVLVGQCVGPNCPKIAPIVVGADRNYGVDLKGIKLCAPYSINGKGVGRGEALNALQTRLTDDSNKYHVTVVGTSGVIPRLTNRDLYHLRLYMPDDWVVKDRGLNLGITVQEPRAKGGAVIYHGLDPVAAVNAVKGIVPPAPKPPEPVKPDGKCPCGPNCPCVKPAAPAAPAAVSVPADTALSWTGILSTLLYLLFRKGNE